MFGNPTYKVTQHVAKQFQTSSELSNIKNRAPEKWVPLSTIRSAGRCGQFSIQVKSITASRLNFMSSRKETWNV